MMKNLSKSFINLTKQAMALICISLLLALAWNHFSVSRIQYGYDYYPAIDPVETEPVTAKEVKPSRLVDWRGRGKISQVGFAEIVSNNNLEKKRWALVDARKDELFNESHIRGAMKFNRYRLAHDLPKVLPKCMAADLVIIYCQGGKCEDSHIAKKILKQSGLKSDNIVILEGGVKQWIENGNEVVK